MVAIGIFMILIYLAIPIGAIVLLIWAICARNKEKKAEKDKLEEYKKY